MQHEARLSLSFTAAESAGTHAHPGASVLMNGVVLDWLADTLNDMCMLSWSDSHDDPVPEALNIRPIA